MNNRFKRKERTRKENKNIYIFTEGTKTEPKYFESKRKEIEEKIRRRGIKIKIKGCGRNTKSLVDFAIKSIKDENVDLGLDDCWVVFDKDSFDNQFDNAINLARSNKLKVAYSNEAFELWFLLHFYFMDNAISRNDYNKKLTDYLKTINNDKKYKYNKNHDIYNLIKDKESNALKNAEILIKKHKNQKSFVNKNPSTTVYLLIKDLNNLKS